ncbi:hypothetical protein KW786_03760 [Candidatus Parcubacteria bacterium]|nr:hypothetical protein [Candidatus Parcubacteria bacterium]
MGEKEWYYVTVEEYRRNLVFDAVDRLFFQASSPEEAERIADEAELRRQEENGNQFHFPKIHGPFPNFHQAESHLPLAEVA